MIVHVSFFSTKKSPTCREKDREKRICSLWCQTCSHRDILTGFEQDGFSANHSKVDHIFTLNCVIDFFLAFFITVNKKKHWIKLTGFLCVKKVLNFGLCGGILEIVKNMYVIADHV